MIINKPFRESSRDEKILNDKGEPIPIFSASMFSSCDWNHYQVKKAPRVIGDELSKIFDKGNVVHREEEYLRQGARNILECEEYMRIVHTSETWGVSGLLDYDKLCFRGGYIEDLKSTKIGGFYFFMKEGVNEDNTIQMSIYSFMKYVCTGVSRSRGVITKIDKEEPLNRLSLVGDLHNADMMTDYLINHPVKKVYLGEISEEDFIALTIKKLKPQVNKNTGEYWKCTNCAYADGTCPVRQGL